MKGLLREPLLHFLLLGAGLFVALDLVGKGSNGDPGRIVVTQGQIEHIAATFARVHERLPDPPELEALIRDHVREEVYVREALALGLDRDDTIIRSVCGKRSSSSPRTSQRRSSRPTRICRPT